MFGSEVRVDLCFNGLKVVKGIVFLDRNQSHTSDINYESIVVNVTKV